jgi:hypothetical protein
MTDIAGGQVHVDFAGAMGIQEVGDFGVIGRPQLGVLRVAIPTGKWRFNGGVADQAIGHLRQCDGRNLVRLFQAPVAGLAGVMRSQARPDPVGAVTGAPQVDLVVDGG